MYLLGLQAFEGPGRRWNQSRDSRGYVSGLRDISKRKRRRRGRRGRNKIRRLNNEHEQ